MSQHKQPTAPNLGVSLASEGTLGTLALPWHWPKPLQLLLLPPAAALYGAAVALRTWAYDRRILSSQPAALPTIAIGGLEVGGTGKTPVVSWVLQRLQDRGLRPGLVSRGYGRRPPAHRQQQQQQQQQAGKQPTMLWQPHDPIEPSRWGDEPTMLARELTIPVPMAITPDRIAGIEALAAAGCNVAVLDDAFSHRQVQRDLNIVVLRGETPCANGKLLPWGPLREPPSALQRADIIWLHYQTHATARAAVKNLHRAAHGLQGLAHGSSPRPGRLSAITTVASYAASTAPRDQHRNPVVLRGAKVIAAAGIANPQRYLDALTQQGAHVAAWLPLQDHHHYPLKTRQYLQRVMQALQATALVVTPKDAVKLAPHWPDPTTLWQVGTRVRVVGCAEVPRRRS